MTFRLRDYQAEWKRLTYEARLAGFSRLLLDAVGGSGKTSFAGALALDAWILRQGRTLILENRQHLVEQTAQRFIDETGLETDIEMGDRRASPHAAAVVASVASYARMQRLTGFSDNHFEYVFADEAHNSTANLFLRVMRYHHFGAASLAEDWVQPKDGEYAPLACIIGITATPDTHGKRNLGNFYQKFVARYSYLQAISDGWLVGLREHNIPCRIDTRRFRKKATDHGTDFSEADETAAIIPIIEELAQQVVNLASHRKTMCYLPSKECVLLMTDSLNRKGLKALAVYGDSLDKTVDTEAFKNHGPGIVLVLCAMHVEGSDFPTCDTVAWFRATLSPAFYKQGIFRCSRTLPGLVTDEMGADGRKSAIAASAKPWSMVISPFFVSDKIDIMSVVDLFVDQSIKSDKRAPSDFTDAAKLRDYIAQLEKAADKHQNRQPRTIDPVKLSVAMSVPHYEPANASDAAPASKEEKDWLLSKSVDTTQIKTSGQAQALIAKLRTREREGLASPIAVQQLLKLRWPLDKATMISSKQAGVLIWKRVEYKEPKEEEAVVDGT